MLYTGVARVLHCYLLCYLSTWSLLLRPPVASVYYVEAHNQGAMPGQSPERRLRQAKSQPSFLCTFPRPFQDGGVTWMVQKGRHADGPKADKIGIQDHVTCYKQVRRLFIFQIRCLLLVLVRSKGVVGDVYER
ncbi:hypothetical protein BD289DRAFT_423835 [Coniella lustricola]|uniref:Secreted protein n=1 Tax=Coniella lustricola TaxID=2025994 RepID=A0A2T3AJ47_9PEZI|nr:hypothetical protein BD289DRAFT_423835 [Coniella lustricola]